MIREKETALLEFCRIQYVDFDEQAWVPFADLSEVELAAVASYLAGAGWFGHEVELERVVRRLLGKDGVSFPELSKNARFEPSRFAGLLKARMIHYARAS